MKEEKLKEIYEKHTICEFAGELLPMEMLFTQFKKAITDVILLYEASLWHESDEQPDEKNPINNNQSRYILFKLKALEDIWKVGCYDNSINRFIHFESQHNTVYKKNEVEKWRYI